jgi:predicted Zn-dependent protease
MKPVRTYLNIGARVLIAAALVSCSSSPLGRKQLTLLPDGQLSQMGVATFDEMKQKTPIEKSMAINNYVNCVASPLISAAAGQMGDLVPEGKWELVVFKDESANAFALPGGKIGVHTGLLKVAKTDAQLAAVIGHEIGHVIAKHSNERVSENLAAQGGLAAVGALTQNSPLLGALLGAGAQFGYLLPHSRTQESEADIIGLDLMARAGFDPHQSVELWKNMEAAGGGGTPEFMSTHPSGSTRISNLGSRIPENMPKYQAASPKPRCTR